MKNTIKRIFVVVLTLSTFLTISFGASAAENNEVTAVLPDGVQFINNVPSENFINFINESFNDENNIIIIDKDGNEITDIVFPVISLFYDSGDYSAIKSYLRDNEFSIGHLQEIQTRAYHRKYFTCPFYQIIRDTTGKLETELMVYLSSTYTYNGNTYEITQIDRPTLSYNRISFDAAYEPTFDTIATSATISSDRMNATCTGSYKYQIYIEKVNNVLVDHYYFFDPRTVRCTIDAEWEYQR